MNKMNIYTFLLCNNLSIFFILLLSKTSSAAHHPQYEECSRPTNCRAGPNISFPFYIPGLKESYCGYPGFELHCSTHGFPTLQLNGNDYVVEQIFHKKRTVRVYNAAVLGSENNTCFQGVETPTLPLHKFNYVNTTGWVHLFSGCQKTLPEGLLRYNVNNCDDWDLAIYDGDENLESAKGICKRDVAVPVDGGDGGKKGNINVLEVLRKGFVLHWTASDCKVCGDSGGHCGFDASIYHFNCFCSDRPHAKSCKSSTAAQTCG